MSERVVIDTSVLIDHLRGRPETVDLLVELVSRGVETWSVTPVRTELLAGMLPREEEPTLRLLDRLRWQDVTLEVADAAGRLANRYPRSHPGIDTVDYLIAAATQHLGARLLTQNVKHFPMLAGLERAYELIASTRS